MTRILTKIIEIFTSYGMACVILLLLCLLTYLGTIAQVELGIFQAQKIYFESMVVWQPVFGRLAVPLPGVYLLLVLFSINLLLGALMRLRRKTSYIGLFVVHGGILFLLLGALIEYKFSDKGQMTLATGQTSSRFESYTDWELAIIDASHPEHDVEYKIPQAEMAGIKPGGTRTIRNAAFPFDVQLTAWYPNADVLPKGPMFRAPTPEVRGFFVQPQALSTKAEENLPAVYATLIDKKTGERREEILWGNSLAPLTIATEAGPWALHLRHSAWHIPFAIQLKRFIREFHPGTSNPRHFESEVVKIAENERQDVSIRMNEPLRTGGYVFFQASYFENPRTGELSSVLAVSRNPTDHWPLYSCIIITFGLLLHFGIKLTRHLRRERSAAA